MARPLLCGTRAGYERHRRRREAQCDRCLHVNAPLKMKTLLLQGKLDSIDGIHARPEDRWPARS